MPGKKVSIFCEGERHVHAAEDPGGIYATMCGLDGEENTVEEVKSTEKITCPQCWAIWCATKLYRRSDFDPSIPK